MRLTRSMEDAPPSRVARPERRPRFGSGERPLAKSLRARVLWQVLPLVSVPALLVALGRAEIATKIFFVALALMLVRLVYLGRRDELLCVLFGASPLVNLLRGLFFYQVVLVLFGGALFYWFVSVRGAARTFFRSHRLVPWLAAYLIAYYFLTFATTRKYDGNLRLLECLCGVLVILVLGRQREGIVAALTAFLGSACVVGAGLFPSLTLTNRLGFLEVGDVSLGNPVQLGLVLALSFVALYIDRGYWLDLTRRAPLRLLLTVPVAILLVLTTSRISWLVVILAMVCQLTFGKRSRALAVVAAGVAVLALKLLLASSAGEGIQMGLDRTFSEERSARNRTSGRSDQWLVSYGAFTESEAAFLIGHGAGSGPRVYARKSLETPGVEYQVGNEKALHSIYMQIAVELGLAGLLPFVIWMGVAFKRILACSRRTGYLLPLVGILSFLSIAASVSGSDTTSGVFLGLGLMGAAYAPRAATRPVTAEAGAYGSRRS